MEYFPEYCVRKTQKINFINGNFNVKFMVYLSCKNPNSVEENPR